MALKDLLYRCPRCGHDPLPGEGDGAECPSCRALYVRGAEGARIRVTFPGGVPVELPPALLTAQIEALGGALGESSDSRGELRRTPVRVQTARREEPVSWRDRLVGFVEQFGPPREATLRVTAERLELLDPSGRTIEGWDLAELTALQGSSSAVQFRSGAGDLHQFRFITDSPRRWEAILRNLVAEAWKREGRGEIVEFQPRITSR